MNDRFDDEILQKVVLLVNNKENIIANEQEVMDILELSLKEACYYINIAINRGMFNRSVFNLTTTGGNTDKCKYLFGVFD